MASVTIKEIGLERLRQNRRRRRRNLFKNRISIKYGFSIEPLLLIEADAFLFETLADCRFENNNI